MKNLLDGSCRERLEARFGSLTPDTPALWGRMSVEQMICHVSDPMRIALGDLEAKDASNFFTRTFLRWMVLAGVPAPKGKVATFPEIDQAAGAGTPPTSLAQDRETLLALVKRFVSRAGSGEAFARSPGFGRLSPRSYGRLMYVHMNHHLKQFGA